MNRAELRGRLEAAGLGRVAGALVDLARDAIAIQRTPVDDASIPIAASKLGGAPDLPPGVPWPETRGVPQAFVAQINCAEAKPFDPTGLLPASGMLYLFVDLYTLDKSDPFWDEEYFQLENWQERLTYFDGDLTSLRRATVPPFLLERPAAEQRLAFPACAVTFERELTPADESDPGVVALELSDTESVAYGDLRWQNDNARSTGGVHHPRHRLFGNADYVQWAFDEPGTWHLLLQIDWDPAIDMCFGDAGIVYLWIREEDLRARRFDRLHFELQMS